MATKKKALSKMKPRGGAAAAKRPAGRRAQNKEAIRKRIVTAALSLFQTRGFDATTTKAIARKAGIAEGTVFNYFRTKEDIALHFFEQEVDQAIASVRDNPRLRKAPLEEKLFALVHSQLEFLAPYEKFIGAAFTRKMNGAPDGHYESILFRTSFTNKSIAAERVILSHEKGQWRVVDYRLY